MTKCSFSRLWLKFSQDKILIQLLLLLVSKSFLNSISFFVFTTETSIRVGQIVDPLRLQPPENMIKGLHPLFNSMLATDPDSRPTFSKIVDALENLMKLNEFNLFTNQQI